MRIAGICIFFDSARGYGFVKKLDTQGRKGVFAHRNEILGSGPRELFQFEQVTYEVEDSPRGPQAVRIQRSAV